MDSSTYSTPTTSSVTAESADAGCGLERLELDGPVDVPKIESLFELESLCAPGKRDCEFWQVAAVGAAHALCLDPPGLDVAAWPEAIAALKSRRYRDWAGHDFQTAEAAICGEFNLFLQSVFQGDDMPATKPKKEKCKPDCVTKMFAGSKSETCGNCGGTGYVDSAKNPSTKDLGFLCMHCTGTGRQDRFSEIEKSERAAAAKRSSEPLMTLEDDVDDEGEPLPKFQQLKQAGKSRPRVTSAVVHQPMEFVLSSIVDSPFQSREEPSEESIEKLSESLSKDGQRDPIRLREVGSKFELLTGHRRVRAARRLKWITIIGVLVTADDAEASRIVFDDNEQRENLNQIERARGLKTVWEQYQAAGKSMDQMAIDIGIDQSTISNRIRLLAAPESLQVRLISGEISESKLRDLARWCPYDGVVERFEKELESRCRDGSVSNGHWYSALRIDHAGM